MKKLFFYFSPAKINEALSYELLGNLQKKCFIKKFINRFTIHNIEH